MNNLVYLFIGFMAGIITAIIFKSLCKHQRRRGSMIVPRRQRVQTIIVNPQSNNINYETSDDTSDDSSNDYSITIDETKEETKEELHIRVAEDV